MAMLEAGVRLIALGAAKFVADIGRAAKEQDKLTTSAQNLGKKFNDAFKKQYELTGKLADSMKRLEIAQADQERIAKKANATTKEIAAAANEVTAATKERLRYEEKLATQMGVVAQKGQDLVDANKKLAQSQTGTAAGRMAAEGGGAGLGFLGNILGGVASQGSLLEGVLNGVSASLAAIGGPAGLAAGALAGLAMESIRTRGVLGTLWEMIKNTTHIDAFAKGLNMALGPIKAFGNAVKNVFETSAHVITSVVGKIVEAGKGLVGTILGWLSPLASFAAKVFAIFGGLSLYGVITNIKQKLGDAFSEIVDALSDLQKRMIQFTALAARDFVTASKGVATFEEALAATSGKAEDLFNWVRQIAVTTPFTVQDIADSVAMANAMGMNVEMAKQMTIATGNFAAGMGLGQEQMYRIIYNMGQMVAMGKLTGREFRDLANSFVPVYSILEELRKSMPEWAKKSREEFRKFAMEGGVPVIDFIKKFIEIANRDFPNSMEKMAKTWQGVTNNFKDFLNTILGVEMFGPAFDKFTAIMANALSRLLGPDIRMVAHNIGEILSVAFDALTNTVKFDLIPSLQKLFGVMTGGKSAVQFLYDIVIKLAAGFVTGIHSISLWVGWIADMISAWRARFGDAAKQAYGWGSSIISQLAKGMFDAMVYVVNAITAIINWIIKQLQAHSAPKSMPKLKEWGAAAVAEYMKGWTQIDYSLFNDIAKTIESYLRSLGSKIPETSLVPLILSMRRVVAKAVEEVRKTGDLSAAMLENIMNASKKLPGNFRNYIRALLDVEKATYAVKRAQDAVDAAEAKVKTAQDALNATTDKYSKILDDLNKQLNRNQEVFDENARLAEINAAIATGLLTADEKARLEVEKKDILLKRQIRTVEDQRDAEVEAQQAKVDAAEAALELVQAQLDAAEKQRDAADEYLEAQKSLIEIQMDNNKLYEEQIALLKRLAEAAKSAAGAADDLSDSLGNMGMGTTETGVSIMEWARQIQNKGILAGLVDQFNETFAQMWIGAKNSFDLISGEAEKLIGPFGAVSKLVFAFQNLLRVINGQEPIPEGAGGRAGEGGAGAKVGKSSFLTKILEPILNAAIDLVGEKLDELGAKVGEKLDKLWTDVEKEIEWKFLEVAVMVSQRLFGPWGGYAIVELFQNLYDTLVGKSIVPDMLSDMYDVFDTNLSNITTNIGTWITNMIQKFIDSLPEWLHQGAMTMYNVYLGMWHYLFDPGGLISQLASFVVSIITGFATAIVNLAGSIAAIGKSIMEGIKKGIADWILNSSWGWVIKLIIEKIQKAQDGGSPARKFIPVGKSIAQGIALGIIQSSGEIGSAINGVTGDMQMRAQLSANGMINAPAVNAPSVVNNSRVDRSVHIEVNPSYKNYQSPANVYYDVAAALAAAGR